MKLVRRTLPSSLWVLGSPLLALMLTVVAGAVLFGILDRPVASTLHAFFVEPVQDAYGLSELALKATPLLLCATGLALCFRAGVWNIGAEGQFVMGALAGGAVALAIGDQQPASVALPAALLAGITAGAIWAAVAALLRTRFGASEILTTIMLNYIAINLLAYAVHGPLQDPAGFNFPESALFSDSALLPLLHPDFRVTLATPCALLALGTLWWFGGRTVSGYQIAVLGADERAARFAGFPTARLTWLVLLLSGALAGLAGISEVTGPVGQLTPHVAFGYGYAAIIVAFLGRLHPAGILFASILLALTYLGGENLQISAGLPKSITALFQGMLLFFLLGCDLLITHRPQLTARAVPA